MQRTFISSYFNNRVNFERQLETWQNYRLSLRQQIQFLLADDASDSPLSVDQAPSLNLTILRIDDDVGYNNGGARNLGAHVAPNGWLLLCDIDHIVTSRAASQMLQLDFDDARVYDTFQRQSLGKMLPPAPNILLIHRQTFWATGGYNEDLSGNYGGEDILFRKILNGHAVQCPTMIELNVPANTSYDPPQREPVRGRGDANDALIAEKLATPGYRPVRPLRFTWHKAFNHVLG